MCTTMPVYTVLGLEPRTLDPLPQTVFLKNKMYLKSKALEALPTHLTNEH